MRTRKSALKNAIWNWDKTRHNLAKYYVEFNRLKTSVSSVVNWENSEKKSLKLRKIQESEKRSKENGKQLESLK